MTICLASGKWLTGSVLAASAHSKIQRFSRYSHSPQRENSNTMLIKSADDKTKRQALLEDLQKSPLLDMRQKKWLREELMRCRKGIQGEKAIGLLLGKLLQGR